MPRPAGGHARADRGGPALVASTARRRAADVWWSAYPWQQFAFRFGEHAAAEAGLEHDHPGPLGGGGADDCRVAAERMRAQRGEDAIRLRGLHADQRLAFV